VFEAWIAGSGPTHDPAVAGAYSDAKSNAATAKMELGLRATRIPMGPGYLGYGWAGIVENPV
jgi:hypothetical protein